MHNARLRSILAMLTAILVGTCVLAGTVDTHAAPPTGQSKSHGKQLGKHDRELISAARLKGEGTVTLLIVTNDNNDAVAAGIEKLGGSVDKRYDSVDYIRATVPIDKVEAAADLGGVFAADVDEIIPLDDPRPTGAGFVNPQTPPGASTPRINPYMPTGDTGAAQFVNANPTWDGRGITIGIVDTGVDLDHPSLNTTSTGDDKVVDWVTLTDPLLDNDPTWRALSGPTAAGATTVNIVGAVHTTPGPGVWQSARFRENLSSFGGEFSVGGTGGDLNRDGDATDNFGILFDPATKDIWVDVDQDLTFEASEMMQPYAVDGDIGHFGVDNGATAVQESVPFVVEYVEDYDATEFGLGILDFVNIGIVSGAHGSHVAGIAAGNSLFGGSMSGAAPGAKIVSGRACLFVAGCTSHALLEGMVWMVEVAQVDIVNMSIGGLPALNDGNNARAAVYNNLIDEFGVQIVISAGNSGAGANTVGDPSVATRALSVGAYASKATWQANYGSDSANVDTIQGYSSRGPREDGGFKPEVVAPGSAISAVPLWQNGQPVGGTYTLPPGYGMFNGTSMAAPQTTGAGALLLSAGLASGGAQFTPAQLRQALASTARFLPGIGAYEQGMGLIRVGEAWNLLQQGLNPVAFTSQVPVNTIISSFLETPNAGVGIHDREGVQQGVIYKRDYQINVPGSGNKSTNYKLWWTGNDGTFASAGALPMKPGKNNKLTVEITPATPGIHSAVLNFDDPATPGIDYQTMNVVVVAELFNAGNGYTRSWAGSIGRNETKSFFVNVPTGVPALKVDMTGGGADVGTGQIRFLRFHPFGLTVEPSNNSLTCYSPPVTGGPACDPNSRTASNPQAGVWEVVVEARRTSDAASAPFTLTAGILGASVSPSPDIIASATLGVPVARNYTVTNLFGAFTGRAVGTTLGSAFRDTPTIANHEVQNRIVNVVAGATSLRATIGSPSDPAADLDLFVYNCTGGNPNTLVGCTVAGQNADGDSEESVTINNPAAGAWVVQVDGFAVPAGTTTYNYVDVFVSPALGSIVVTDADALRAAGAVWNVAATVTANTAPAAGRVLLGNIQVRTDTNVLVGSGDVVIQSVTP